MAENEMKSADDVAAENAAVAAKMAAQDINGLSSASKPDPETIDALDNAMKAKIEEKEVEIEIAPKPADGKTAAEEAAAAKKAADEKTAAEEAAKKTTEGDATPAKKAADATTEDFFKDVILPPGVRPKSAEAFATVKSRANQEIATRNAEVAKLLAENATLKKQTEKPLPDDVQKEMEELRQFRAKLDVEADPQFKEFDQRVSRGNEFIYSQLKKTGIITDEHIAEIKKYGGPANVKLEKVFTAINDPHVQRIIETKLAEIETAQFEKEQKVKETKENIGAYVKQREEAFSQSATAHNSATKQSLDGLRGQMEFLTEKPVPKDADENTKKGLEAHNKFVKDTNAQLEIALNDDSPDMRALLLAGMAQLFQLQRVHGGARAELVAVKAQLDEANKKLEKLKGASVGRVRETAAPKDGKLPNAEPKKNSFDTHPLDALDAIRNQVLQAKQTANA